MKINITFELKEKVSECDFMQLFRAFVKAGNEYALTDFKVVKWNIEKGE
jgi:hypothetical protein